MEACARCGGRLRIIASIDEPEGIAPIHLIGFALNLTLSATME
jgi:hypothetical protein